METSQLLSQLSRKDLVQLLNGLKSSNKREDGKKPTRRRELSMVLVVVCAVVLGVILACRDKQQATRGHCVVPMPVDSKTIFRPPVDCSVCRDVHQVDVVVNITPAEFEENYAYSGRPVVVKNALVNWTATELFSYEFFKELYGSTGGGRRPAKHRCQFFPYRTEFRSLSHALAMTPERIARPFYFGWSNCDSETADVLRQHYARPYFLPERSESSRTDWIFMGTAGLGAHMHVDHVGLPSWQAQIRGRKLWSLEPPPECYYQCQSMDITVEPGDTIVLDTNVWYHKTSVVSGEISITIGSEYD